MQQYSHAYMCISHIHDEAHNLSVQASAWSLSCWVVFGNGETICLVALSLQTRAHYMGYCFIQHSDRPADVLRVGVCVGGILTCLIVAAVGSRAWFKRRTFTVSDEAVRPGDEGAAHAALLMTAWPWDAACHA